MGWGVFFGLQVLAGAFVSTISDEFTITFGYQVRTWPLSISFCFAKVDFVSHLRFTGSLSAPIRPVDTLSCVPISRLHTLRLRHLGTAIRHYCSHIPLAHGHVSRVNMGPRRVGALTSVGLLPFVGGASLHSRCPLNLVTSSVDRVIHFRTSSNAANGPVILTGARGSVRI